VIELFDAPRLRPRVDHSLALAALGLGLVALALGAYGWTLQNQLHAQERQRSELQQRLQAPADAAAPSPALLAELDREARSLEAAAGFDAGDNAAARTSPAAWMQQLAALGTPDIGLTRIELGRDGQVRLEGRAASAQAVSRFVAAWDQAPGAHRELPPRAVELHHADDSAPGLRFTLRASTTTVEPGP
jgi:hypothetical protein